MDRSARSRLAPRLLLVFAVLACVFGWGQSIAAAAGPGFSTPSAVTAAAGSTEVHAVHPAAEKHLAQADGSEQGHGGHGSNHDHSISCMTSTGGSISAAPAFSDVVSPAPASVALAAYERQAIFAPGERRAPDVATLCVQRI